MTTEYDVELRRISRGLSEIAHVLEAVDDAPARIEHALVLAREVVPYRLCALLDAQAGDPARLFAVPAPTPEDRQELLRRMKRIVHLVADGEEIGRSTFGPRPHLALPVIGLDKVIGVLWVEHEAEFTYEARHLRLLSVIATQLGAYLTILRLRDADARRSEELAAAHDFQQMLVGIVSHDLRNPLAVITLAAQRLLQTPRDARETQLIERALRNAQKASRIIGDLLDVTRSRVTGEMPVAKEHVDLVGVVRTIVDDLRLSHPNLELRGAEGETYGDWDPDRLSQVVTNLLNNAIQHGARGEPVIVTIERADDDVRISVHNGGPAISEELLPTIFDPFRRGRRGDQRAAKQGLGLGLYIVDRIVQAHGGRVEASSDAQTGTTFTVTLPRSAAEDVAGDRRGRGTVMVVDDEEDVRLGIADILEEDGYEVVQAQNGADALDTLKEGCRPRLILLDLSMPVMDGETFCERCREDSELASIPILVISADVAGAVKLARSRAAGMLAKPVRRESLLRAIARSSD